VLSRGAISWTAGEKLKFGSTGSDYSDLGVTFRFGEFRRFRRSKVAS